MNESELEQSYFGSKLRRNESILGILLILPLVLWMIFAIVIPLISAIKLSFQDVGMIGSKGNLIGFENYRHVLTDPNFWKSFGRSLIWVISNAVIQTVVAFISAVILMQKFHLRSLARVWIILSWIVPTVVVIIIWRWMLGTSGGIVNYLLVSLGVLSTPVGFFSTANSAFISIVLINSWRWFPLMTVILLAGMEGIPQELYEAASIDGATGWQQFLRITFPMLRPVLYVLGLIGTLWSINVFDIIWLATGGGPSNATMTLPVYIYNMAFKGYRLSRASAASIIMGIILLVFVIVYDRINKPADAD
jgi:multiple sugar transport system permease protein